MLNIDIIVSRPTDIICMQPNIVSLFSSIAPNQEEMEKMIINWKMVQNIISDHHDYLLFIRSGHRAASN